MKTMCMIVSDTDTVLVYNQTKLRWSAKLSYHPCIVARASFKVPTNIILMFLWTFINSATPPHRKLIKIIYNCRRYKGVWFYCRKLVTWGSVILAPNRWYLWLPKNRSVIVMTPITNYFNWKKTYKISPR